MSLAYTASLALAGEQATFCEIKFRRTLKLVVGYQPFEMVTERLKNGHLSKLQTRLKVYTPSPPTYCKPQKIYRTLSRLQRASAYRVGH